MLGNGFGAVGIWAGVSIFTCASRRINSKIVRLAVGQFPLTEYNIDHIEKDDTLVVTLILIRTGP